jgi:hypothetical protein
VQEVRPATWNALQDELYQGSWNEELRRYRSTSVFRGMNDARYHLTTTLARLGEEAGEIEGAMLRVFRKYARLEVLPDYSLWNWLALAQHHGLCTRLMDWTYSPLVAMHFATEGTEHQDVDGVIWSIDVQCTNQLLPERLQRILAEERSTVFTAEMLSLAAESLAAFDSLAEEPFAAFFEPPSLDERIVNQYALFSLVSNPALSLGDWLCRCSVPYRRIVVPAELKPEIRDKLDQGNINERVLYAGLDGLSRWLNRYYAPRNGPRGDSAPHPDN